MKCSPFSRRFMMRKRDGYFFRRRHLSEDRSSMSDRMDRGHDHRHRMVHGDFEHHRRHFGHSKHHRIGHRHHMHHERHHGKHPKMCHLKKRQLELTREASNESNVIHESNQDGLATYAPKSKSQVTRENNIFQINLDTSWYQPNEVSVKIIGNKIEISAVHESIAEEWLEFHEMYRSFDIPGDVSPDTITSHLDSAGKLTIEATIYTDEDAADVREIPVIQLNE